MAMIWGGGGDGGGDGAGWWWWETMKVIVGGINCGEMVVERIAWHEVKGQLGEGGVASVVGARTAAVVSAAVATVVVEVVVVVAAVCRPATLANVRFYFEK